MHEFPLAMRGNISDANIMSLLEGIHGAALSGMLRVGRGLDGAVIFFREGEIYRCEWGRLEGHRVLGTLLRVRSAPYAIIDRATPIPRSNVAGSTRALLDEVGRYAAAAEKHTDVDLDVSQDFPERLTNPQSTAAAGGSSAPLGRPAGRPASTPLPTTLSRSGAKSAAPLPPPPRFSSVAAGRD